MLAVVAIITIVLSILLPSLGKSRETVRSAMCQNNLHQLHIAYVNRNVDVKAGTVGRTTAYTWQAALLPYLSGKDNRVFFCQQQAAAVSGGDTSAYGGASSAAGNAYLKVFNAYPNGYLYDMAMEEGPLCRRISKATSDATIDQLWSNYPSIAATIKSLRNQLPNDVAYLLCFEDLRPGGGDLDFEDVIFQIDEVDDGVNITFLYDGAGYQFDLVNGDGTVIAAQLDNNGQWKPNSGAKFVKGSLTSYGMTDQTYEFSLRGGKNVIFMLDYQRSVAKCASTNGLDPWTDWLNSKGVEQFARHWDKANVMFFDGGVRLMSPLTIKPSIAQNRTDYWNPFP